MTQNEANTLKAETGAISIYVNPIYKKPTPVFMYNKAQEAFMRQILQNGDSIFPDLLNDVFSTRINFIDAIEQRYHELIDLS